MTTSSGVISSAVTFLEGQQFERSYSSFNFDCGGSFKWNVHVRASSTINRF